MGQHAAVVKVDGMYMFTGGQHGNDIFGIADGLFNIARSQCARLYGVFNALGIQIKGTYPMTRLNQVRAQPLPMLPNPIKAIFIVFLSSFVCSSSAVSVAFTTSDAAIGVSPNWVAPPMTFRRFGSDRLFIDLDA